MDEPLGMGSVEIGTGQGTYALLTATTVAALEYALREAMENGDVFTLRFREEKTGRVASTIINGATQVKFAYVVPDVDEQALFEKREHFVSTLRRIDELTVVIPQD